MKRAALLLAIVVVLAACKSVPAEIPDDLSQAELIQLAQESADSEKWDAALAYYQAVLDRFPQDQGAAVTAQYEMGFIEYKQGHNAEARAIFEQILAQYDFDGGALPQWPRVLAERLILEISAKTETTAAE
jgi:outer membrane protein assembly factor BamD (BamD/ComL family)